MNLKERIIKRSNLINSFLCIGLDSDFDKLPARFRKRGVRKGIFEFNQWIIKSTHECAAAFKPNVVFYAGYGIEGLKALLDTTKYIHRNFPDIPIIADCKRSEMKRSGELAAREIFEEFGFDALIVTPWFGFDTIEPYTRYSDKGVFVLCKDSNPTAPEIQDLPTEYGGKKMKVYEVIAHLVRDKWGSGNVFCEAPLTYPDDLARVREIVGAEMIILIAGLGAQGGKAKNLKRAFGKDGRILVNASRAVIFASDPRTAALNLRDEIHAQEITWLLLNKSITQGNKTVR